ncbi:MAG: DUF2007 domain-containing protein [Sphingobacteriia bacterium]|nr:DUF2007 domain-containing protein [Sphingobacteriia bacterium]NCC38556.1 DUF2007 domain-containing protein [Gammaproteobacteria bacterium]
MKPLYEARDRIEAQLLLDYLERHLLEAVILGDHLAGAAGGLPADIYPTVWILDDESLERGRELLARFQADSVRPDTPDWTCACCAAQVEGDFDVCWRCGHVRSDTDTASP